MKKSNLFFLYSFLICASINAIAQSEKSADSVTSVFKVNILLPGVSYEQKLTQLATLNFDLYMDVLLLGNNDSYVSGFSSYPTPSFKIELRSYYNLLKRAEKGLRTAQNSANYLAPVYMARWSPTQDGYGHEMIHQVGAVWGFQRNTPSGFSIDFNAGLVHTVNAEKNWNYSPIQPVTQLRLGYWIGRKSK